MSSSIFQCSVMGDSVFAVMAPLAATAGRPMPAGHHEVTKHWETYLQFLHGDNACGTCDQQESEWAWPLCHGAWFL